MPDALLERLVSERDQRLALIHSVTQTAADGDRDLSDQDRETITAARTRVAAIDAQVDLLADDLEMSDTVRDRLSRLQPGTVSAGTVQYRSAGELLHDMLHQHDREAQHRYGRFLSRAAEHMGTTAANTVPVAGGFGALLVAPVIGPVADVSPQGRPFLSAMGVTPAPSAMSFMRPRIVDPDLDTGVAPQSKEKAELVSKKFDFAADTLTLVTVGGYLNVSQQLQSLVPSSLDVIVGQMNKRLARATEFAAITELEKSGAKITLAAGADGPTILQAIFDASALVYQNTGDIASWIAMGPLGWARLGGLTDLAGRPLFPYLGASNAMGTASADMLGLGTVAGLRPIVTYGIDDDTFWVGNSSALEFYEYRYPLLEAVEPSLLGRQIAVASSIVAYRPTTKEAGPSNTPPAEQNGAVHLAP